MKYCTLNSQNSIVDVFEIVTYKSTVSDNWNWLVKCNDRVIGGNLCYVSSELAKKHAVEWLDSKFGTVCHMIDIAEFNYNWVDTIPVWKNPVFSKQC